jgi:glycosyltransferase involved in cell wall biosynthesis
MRIGFDAGPAIGERGGVGWYTHWLLHALFDLKEEIEFVCYVPPGSLQGGWPAGWEQHPNVRWVQSPRILMGWKGRLDGLDLFHGTNFKMRTAGRCGAVVTIHDLWLDRYPKFSTKFLGQRHSSRRTKRTAWRARKVITISEHSARELQSLYGLPPERIRVIPCGVSEEFRPIHNQAAMQALRRKFSIPTEAFILFVGGADPRKNHEVLIRACAQRPELLNARTLVMVGDKQHRFGDIMATATGLGLAARVVCTGRLNFEDLQLLYSHADVFVFPSIYEGFGMPVLEALACGVPVITSNSTSLPEVAGDAALLVNPHDPMAVADALSRVIADEALRKRLRAKGTERVKQFTWSRAAQQTVALYRELCQ